VTTHPHIPADKQEYLNAGLSTAFVGKKSTALQSSQYVSIMKTINQSSVMTNNTTGGGGVNGRRAGVRQYQQGASVMTNAGANQIGSVMSVGNNGEGAAYAIDENF
jgi:hypothetical protein